MRSRRSASGAGELFYGKQGVLGSCPALRRPCICQAGLRWQDGQQLRGQPVRASHASRVEPQLEQGPSSSGSSIIGVPLGWQWSRRFGLAPSR